MTIQEVHRNFDIGVDKVDSFNSDLIEPEEKDVLLNTAMYELVKQCTKEGIEETQTKTDMLSALKVVLPISGFAANNILTNQPNGYDIPLPDDYLKTIKAECIVETTDCHGAILQQRRIVVPATEDRILLMMENPFQKPSEKYVLRLSHTYKNSTSSKGVHEIITHDLMPAWYLLTYYREPVPMQYGTAYATPTTDVDCELNIEAQYWIIEEAVRQALLNIESQRYPAKTQEQEKLNY